MFSYVDTHCHLDKNYFPDGPKPVLKRALDARVKGFVCIGVGRELDDMRYAVRLAETYPNHVAATVGVHPHDAKNADQRSLDLARELGQNQHVVGIGEIGLDYFYDHSPKEEQKKIFASLIAVAKELKKPVVIHTRNAKEDTLELLTAEKAYEVGGIIHCFSEDIPFARRVLDMGFYLSFSGIVTFKTAISVHETAAWVPLDRMLIETDSPYLAPVPYRGKACEPSMVVHTANKLAELRRISAEEVAQATSANAELCFKRAWPETLLGNKAIS